MPRYIVPVDLITVHVVPVLAATPEAAQREAERIVTADWETWYDHTEPVCVGDALTPEQWDAEQKEAPRLGLVPMGTPGRRPVKATPAAKPRAPRTDHHADGSKCPPSHKHTSSGKPLTDGCTGRAYSTATCTCGWTTRNTAKGYTDETRRRHLATEHG
ncbi:hypothetical protein ACFXAF_00900 [Kitasatospora sp. NPDC059463]|uniref:hypothetical protein n=1 Tax=unclassified Kitasatospora TaxID=2633591 RepID=UPI0036ACC579